MGFIRQQDCWIAGSRHTQLVETWGVTFQTSAWVLTAFMVQTLVAEMSFQNIPPE